MPAEESEARNSQTSNVSQAATTGAINKNKDVILVKSTTSHFGKNNTDNSIATDSNDAAQTSRVAATKTDECLIKPVSNRQQFDTFIETIKDKYVLVWFSAIWCGPCKILAEKFHELAQTYRNKLEILKVDVDDLEDLALENEVSIMPAYLIMRNGQKLAYYCGTKQEQIDELIEKYLQDKSN